MKADNKVVEGTLWAIDCGSKQVIFRDYDVWLYPLFKFYNFIETSPHINIDDILVLDTIIGKGAAVLLIKIGIQHCYGHTVSEGAIRMLQKHNVDIEAHEIIKQIGCETESIIQDGADINEAYEMLLARSKKRESS